MAEGTWFQFRWAVHARGSPPVIRADVLGEWYSYTELPGISARITDLVVKSAVKDALAENNVSADFYDALNDEVATLLVDAARRAEANDRKTVQSRDL